MVRKGATCQNRCAMTGNEMRNIRGVRSEASESDALTTIRPELTGRFIAHHPPRQRMQFEQHQNIPLGIVECA